VVSIGQPAGCRPSDGQRMAAPVRAMILTGLPFPVRIDGDVGGGHPATLRVALVGPLQDTSFDQLRCVVPWFTRLAQLGAYGGSTIAPASGCAELTYDEPDARSLQPAWYFNELRVDAAAVTSLANLLYAAGHPIRSMVLAAGGASSPAQLTTESYPERQASIPFVVDGAPSSRAVDLTIDFVNDLDPVLEPRLCDAVRLWSLVCALGGFREPGPLGERPDLIPDDEPEVTLDQLTFAFRDHGMHEAAYDALLHLIARFSEQHQRVARVTID
jgi:hypothetical protein